MNLEGKILWTRKAGIEFRHNSVCAGDGKIFCIDGSSPERLEYIKKSGIELAAEPVLYCLDAGTGKIVWEERRDIRGTWLACSEEKKILLEAGSSSRDRAIDETKNYMAARKSSDGSLLWTISRDYEGPPILHPEMIITQAKSGKLDNTGFAIKYSDGKDLLKKNPLCDAQIPWEYSRAYGCGTAIASTNLVSFRSGAAGFLDINGAGTSNLGGFKSGCSSNLIVADGVLSAPDYTRTCTCSYQNQSSVSFISKPENELWSYVSDTLPDDRDIDRLGVNFGVPGCRLAENGVLWINFPTRGVPQPKIKVSVKPSGVTTYLQHSLLSDGSHPWITASGIIGMDSLSIDMEGEGSYDVRLFFSEPELDCRKGDRIFTVILNEREILSNFDVLARTGKALSGFCAVFKDIKSSSGKINLKFKSDSKMPPLISGIEIVRK